MQPESPQSIAPPPVSRLGSLDAYRGFIMLAMASAGFGFAKVAKEKAFADNASWQALAYQFDHVAWTGCGFWDLIQPSFMFMVGVAIPYSYASRKAKGDSECRIFSHVVLRSFLLILLGVFLSSNWSKQTDFVFVNVLAQIGLGYSFVYLLRGRGLPVQLTATALILVGYWLWFATFTVPGSDFNFASVGVKDPAIVFDGFFAHWNMNVNAAAHFDEWFLNLFPRPEKFKFNTGGYQTLNFVPSMATMIFGLMAGELLRSSRELRSKLKYLLLASGICLALGFGLGETVCPIVKRIWTPSWAIFSSGWTFLMLAAFYSVIDLGGYRRWAFPFIVVGMNSIAMYCMSQLLKPWIAQTIKIHYASLRQGVQNLQGDGALIEGLHRAFSYQPFEGIYGPIVQSTAVLMVLWCICLWLYRSKIFLKI